jgi:hypothetical protein
MDERLDDAQQEVNRLMGRCVLRLQQYEARLKTILASCDVSKELQDIDGTGTTRLARASRQTLGRLVKTFVGSVLVSGEPVEGDEEDLDGDQPLFRMTIRLSMSDEDYARTETELRELVQLRNELVHHFMERHDLWTLAGCRAAQTELTASCAVIGAHVARLREWAGDLDRVREEIGREFASDAFRERIVNGINPDGTVFWPAAGIVLALRHASKELAVEGWTEVAAAANWIAERDPGQAPGKYGCSTLHQVLHDSGQFDLRRLKMDGVTRRSYRLRDHIS